MNITKTCPICGKTTVITVDADAYTAWHARRVLIQDAFPTLSLEVRECLISGMCLPCQEAFFEEEEE